MKNRNEMTTREYLEYIPTEVKNGFLDEEDLIRREIVRYIRVDEEKIHTSLSECIRYLSEILAENPGKNLYVDDFDYGTAIYYKDEENDDEYTGRLCGEAIFNERNKEKERKLLKEKEYQKELAKLNKKYGRS